MYLAKVVVTCDIESVASFKTCPPCHSSHVQIRRLALAPSQAPSLGVCTSINLSGQKITSTGNRQTKPDCQQSRLDPFHIVILTNSPIHCHVRPLSNLARAYLWRPRNATIRFETQGTVPFTKAFQSRCSNRQKQVLC